MSSPARDTELQPSLAAEHSTAVTQQPVNGEQLPATQQPVNGKQLPATQQPVNGKQPPAAERYMKVPTTTSTDCPPGLECLASLEHLLVHQSVEPLEACISFETANAYAVKNNLGEEVFRAMEKSECFYRNCFGSERQFEMAILDKCNKEVIHLQRPVAFTLLSPSIGQKMNVYAPPGSLLGSVQQNRSFEEKSSFYIKNSSGNTVLSIEGPPLPWESADEVLFDVLNAYGTVVGKIHKEYDELKDLFSDADNFKITFPMDLDVRMKAVILGACILIDYMYFEKSYDNNSPLLVEMGVLLANSIKD